MTPEQNKNLLTTSIDEILNGRNFALTERYFMPDFKRHDMVHLFPDDYRPKGPEQHISTFLAGIPDLRMDVIEAIAEGDRVCIRYELHGTHTGELLGRAGTGKPVRWGGVNFYRFVDGKIAESWQYPDALSLLRQLGALPSGSPGSA